MAEKKYIGKPGKQDDPCWKGYEMVGMKKKGGRKVPNCVPEAKEIIEKAKAKSKKDPLTGAKFDKARFILPEEQMEEGWVVKKGTEVVSTHKTKDEADVKAMKHPLYKVYAKEELELEEKRGLWDNIHAKRERIKHGSGERMRKPGSKGAPTDAALKASQTEAANPAQQAAIAIAMKKAGKKPKNEELEEAYGMWKVDFPKQHAGKAVAAGSVHVKAQNSAHAHKVAAKRVGVDHKVFKTKVTKSSILPEGKSDLPWEEDPKNPSRKVGERKDQYGNKIKNVAKHLAKKAMSMKEELGKDNEWGRPELRKKYAAMTPGQEGLAADAIPTFDPRYDDVPTKFSGLHPVKEETLNEISAKGAIAREKFRAKLQKRLADPKAIAKAKKTLAKKKEEEKKAPKNLVHQLHKSISVGSKVKFHDNSEHEIAPNHADKFMSKYHSLKSSIEKEALVKRAHKSHSAFMTAIHEETCDMAAPMLGVEKPCTCDISGPNYPTPPVNTDVVDYNQDGREDEYDAAALENDVAAEIDSAEWEDLVDYYEDDDMEWNDEQDDDEGELEEAITPQGRLKKKFNAMRTKTRRNMARNLALKRVATPDRIKARSVRAARNMVYKRMLRGRDRSTLSSTEKQRIEAQVKRMAPMVSRLSLRLQQKERQIDRSRVANRYKKKGKK